MGDVLSGLVILFIPSLYLITGELRFINSVNGKYPTETRMAQIIITSFFTEWWSTCSGLTQLWEFKELRSDVKPLVIVARLKAHRIPGPVGGGIAAGPGIVVTMQP
jgi:hypothetical protein